MIFQLRSMMMMAQFVRFLWTNLPIPGWMWYQGLVFGLGNPPSYQTDMKLFAYLVRHPLPSNQKKLRRVFGYMVLVHKKGAQYDNYEQYSTNVSSFWEVLLAWTQNSFSEIEKLSQWGYEEHNCVLPYHIAKALCQNKTALDIKKERLLYQLLQQALVALHALPARGSLVGKAFQEACDSSWRKIHAHMVLMLIKDLLFILDGPRDEATVSRVRQAQDIVDNLDLSPKYYAVVDESRSWIRKYLNHNSLQDMVKRKISCSVEPSRPCF